MPNDHMVTLCISEYENTMNDAERLYQHCAFVLGLLVLVGGAAFFIGQRAASDTTFFGLVSYFSILVFTLFYTLALIFLSIGTWPREYLRMQNLREWQAWKESYQAWQNRRSIADPDSASSEPDQHTKFFKEYCAQATEISSNNRKLNTKRRQAMNWALKITVVSLAPLGLASISLLWSMR